MKPDLLYQLMEGESTLITAQTQAGREFLEDYLPSGRCWTPRLRTDFGTGYIQLAEGRGLLVQQIKTT